MYVRTHWGRGESGGSLVEVGTAETRLLFAAAVKRLRPADTEKGEPFRLEGLTHGVPMFDWVFLTGQERDLDWLEEILPGIDVFAGNETIRMLENVARRAGRQGPEIYLGFRAKRPIQLDDVRVTPLTRCGSGEDVDSFLLQAEGKAVVYTSGGRPVENALETVRGQLGIREPLELLIWDWTDMGTFLECGAGRWMPRPGEHWEIR